MNWELALLLYCFLVGVLLTGGVWIGTGLGVAGVIGITLLGGFKLWQSFGDVLWNITNSFTLTAVPLFIFMGTIVLRSGISRRFYNGIVPWLRGIPGGLLQSNIVACAIFAAISGSSTATAMTIGTVAIPEMRARGYEDNFLLGNLAAGGTLGILIPPSIPMVIYGSIVQESIADLFIAGVLPGIILALMFMTYVLIRVLLNPRLTPPKTRKSTLKELFIGLLNCWPVMILVFLIMGGIYFGVVTPTEAAAIGCGAALLLSLIYRELTWRFFWESLSDAIAANCVIMFIIAGAQILSFAFVSTGIPLEITNFIVTSQMSKWTFFFLLMVVYMILGCFIDGISIMLLTVPILFMTIKSMGFNAIWFGVVLVVMIEFGQLTPPMGLNLFAIQAISGGRPLSAIVKPAIPYTVPMFLLIVLLYLFPDIALFLPTTMMRR